MGIGSGQHSMGVGTMGGGGGGVMVEYLEDGMMMSHLVHMRSSAASAGHSVSVSFPRLANYDVATASLVQHGQVR